jgi:hypothetical protein
MFMLFVLAQGLTAQERANDVAFEEASASLETCYRSMVPSQDRYVTATCKGSWRGIDFTMTQNWNIEISIPVASDTPVRWHIWCRTDKVESLQTCGLMSGGPGGRLSIGNGFPGDIVFWGPSGSVYPGSQKVAKIGNLAPVRFAENLRINSRVSGAMIDQMRNADSAVFRYQDWPYNRSVDIEISLRSFSDVVSLYHASLNIYRKFD